MELRGDQARVREELYKVFPGIHFTIMSVVQGVAISQLAGSLTGILKNHDIGIEQKYLALLYGLMSFGGMIVLTFEYSYYVALVRRPPLITDIAMPIILGTFQLWPLFFLDDTTMWWLLTGLFALAGVTAYINTLTRPFMRPITEAERDSIRLSTLPDTKHAHGVIYCARS